MILDAHKFFDFGMRFAALILSLHHWHRLDTKGYTYLYLFELLGFSTTSVPCKIISRNMTFQNKADIKSAPKIS